MPILIFVQETFNSLCMAPKNEKFERRIDRISVQQSPHCRKYRPGPLEFPGARYWPWGSAEARINEELFVRHRRKFDLSSVNGCQPIPLPPQMPKEQPYLGRTRFPLYINGPCKKIVCHPIIEPPKCPKRQLVDDCTAEPEQTYANFANALLTMSHRIIWWIPPKLPQYHVNSTPFVLNSR